MEIDGIIDEFDSPIEIGDEVTYNGRIVGRVIRVSHATDTSPFADFVMEIEDPEVLELVQTKVQKFNLRTTIEIQDE